MTLVDRVLRLTRRADAAPRARLVMTDSAFPARHYSTTSDGRLRCDVCPRECTLSDGQRGLCFVRAREGDRMVLTTYGRSSGFCVDPIEKKPLAHFFPGSSVLSFGTAGCNLTCKFCQNWDISKARAMDRLQDEASPEQIAEAAVRTGARSVAYTYNDPVIFLEYAVDVAHACRARGVKNVAVTAGYVKPEARADFFAPMDATNVDLKAFTEGFYGKLCTAELAPVLDTLRWLVHESHVWTEITTLLIPGHNDGDDELRALSRFVADELSVDVPLHFSAFHPDWRMQDVPATPPATLQRARSIAHEAGLRYVYTGNVHDPEGQSTRCPSCQARVIGRDGYRITGWSLDRGRCRACGTAIAGHFEESPGTWGSRRLPVQLATR
jgi:pyruvate formate lyase activating enzyme